MKNIQKLLFIAILITGGVSCKKDFLEEEPVDFFSTANAFKTEADFNASVNNLYGRVRHHYYTNNDFEPFRYLYRTDGFFEITTTTPNLAAEVNPTNGITNWAWAPNYKIIAEANTIISRFPGSLLTDAQKTLF
jgi:hypothetical protein